MGERRSTSWLVLLELVFVLAFFAFSCAVCLRLFAEARAISTQARELSRAAGHAQNAAEAFKAAGADPAGLARLLEGEADGQTVTVLYDEGWRPTAAGGRYRLTLSLSQEEGDSLRRGEIQVEHTEAPPDDEPIFSLSLALYDPVWEED